MSHYVTIIIGCSELAKLKQFFRQRLPDEAINFKHREIERYDCHIYYCVDEDIQWDAAYQTHCDRICRLADQAELSYFVLNVNKRTQEVIKISNDHQPFYNGVVGTQVCVHCDISIFDQCRPTFKDWMLNQFDRIALTDICRYGADSGWPELIYYHETLALYERYHDGIWNMLFDDCENQGYKTIPEFIATFKGTDVTDDSQFKNLLVWYAAERIAFDLTQGEYPCEDEEDDDDDFDADDE